MSRRFAFVVFVFGMSLMWIFTIAPIAMSHWDGTFGEEFMICLSVSLLFGFLAVIIYFLLFRDPDNAVLIDSCPYEPVSETIVFSVNP